MEVDSEAAAGKDETAMEHNEGVVEKTQEINKEITFSLKRKPSSADSDPDECNINVVARVRPLNPLEVLRKDKALIEFPGEAAIWIDNQGKTKPFSFHAVFQPGCSQTDVFSHSGMQNLLDMALKGYACTAFAYGQTGSGKTFTLTGPVTPEATELAPERSTSDPDSYGLIQYSFAYLMDQVALKTDTIFTIKASYLEIYNEQVQDLLNPSAYDAAQVRWSKTLGFYVENLFIREVETLEDLMTVLEDGMKNRAVAEHNMNEHSSRSHSILTVYLDSESSEEGELTVTKHGKVSFVDLAGSEKVKETGSTGEMLIEATNINRSLLTLGNCISALSDIKKRGGHIPYRDSKLTKLLADSLGGSGVTLMTDEGCWCGCHDLEEIACVTPSSYNLSETLNTLRYAKRARKIKNKPVVHIDPREELILKLQREMKLLRQENHFLRHELEFPQREKPRFPQPNTADGPKVRPKQPSTLPTLPPIKPGVGGDGEERDQSPGQRSMSDNSLYEMLQEYMVENEALRNENLTLLSKHSVNEREHKTIASENDRLSRKLEDLSRLMMSSPAYGSSFFSRTTSGRSNLSFQSFTSTPLSQQIPYHKQISKKSDTSSFAGYAVRGNHQAHPGPMHAWNSSPQQANGDLPPLRRSPQPNKRAVPLERGLAQAQIKQKWKSIPSYAAQFQQRQTWNRELAKHQRTSQKGDNDVMKDFPMRDYKPTAAAALRGEYVYHPSESDSTYNEYANGHVSSAMRDTSDTGRFRPDFHVRFGKKHNPAVGNHQQGNSGGNPLPDEAYKAQDISPRSMTKELSATSLRRLNHQMRQELGVLDKQISSYQKTINSQSKKKIPAT